MHGAVALGLLHVASAAVTSWSGALDPSYDPCELAEWSCDFCEWADVHEIPVEGIFTKCYVHEMDSTRWTSRDLRRDCGHASWQTCGENERNDAADQYIKASELPDGALEMHDARMLSSATYDWATQLPLTATATVQDWTGLEEYLQERIVDLVDDKILDRDRAHIAELYELKKPELEMSSSRSSFSIWLSSKNNAFEDRSTIEARLVSTWVPYGEFMAYGWDHYGISHDSGQVAKVWALRLRGKVHRGGAPPTRLEEGYPLGEEGQDDDGFEYREFERDVFCGVSGEKDLSMRWSPGAQASVRINPALERHGAWMPTNLTLEARTRAEAACTPRPSLSYPLLIIARALARRCLARAFAPPRPRPPRARR